MCSDVGAVYSLHRVQRVPADARAAIQGWIYRPRDCHPSCREIAVCIVVYRKAVFDLKNHSILVRWQARAPLLRLRAAHARDLDVEGSWRMSGECAVPREHRLLVWAIRPRLDCPSGLSWACLAALCRSVAAPVARGAEEPHSILRQQ